MNKKYTIVLFTVCTFVLTSILLSLNSELANALSQATPAFMAIIIILFSGQKKKEITQAGLMRLGGLHWYVFALTLPILAILFSYFSASNFGYFTINPQFSWYVVLIKILILTFMPPLIWAIGEEIGWRGFLQPKLTELFGLRQGIFLTGLIWAVWHYLFIFIAGYYEEGNLLINTGLFTVTLLLMSFVLGWIRVASQSVWPCVLFHSASNAAWQMCSYQFKSINPNYIYVSGEAGLLNIVFWVFCILIIWNKFSHNRFARNFA